jgi:hypothetical protein
MERIVKQQNYGLFNVQIIGSSYETMSGPKEDYTVIYSSNGKNLEEYDSKDYEAAEQDYNTICDAIRNVLHVIRSTVCGD